jgi:hypothetical protein
MAELLTSFRFRYSLYLDAVLFDGKLQADWTVIPLYTNCNGSYKTQPKLTWKKQIQNIRKRPAQIINISASCKSTTEEDFLSVKIPWLAVCLYSYTAKPNASAETVIAYWNTSF